MKIDLTFGCNSQMNEIEEEINYMCTNGFFDKVCSLLKYIYDGLYYIQVSSEKVHWNLIYMHNLWK